MSDFGLRISVREGSNDGPVVPGAVASGTLIPATAGDDGIATVEGLNLTVTADGFEPYVSQPYHHPSLDGVVPISLQRKPPHPPFTPAPRFWRGNLCGMRIGKLPAVAGGAGDPALVLSWFYDRYLQGTDRKRIRDAWKGRGYTHVALSWPDSRSAGATPEGFLSTVQELIDDGFFPCVFWCSKDHDTADVGEILAGIARPLELLRGVLPLACIGWELSLWLSPSQVQRLIDAIAPPLVEGGCHVYVHFQQGYGSFQQDGGIFADFWKLQVGKLTGLLHQKILTQNQRDYYTASGGLVDILDRFSGKAFCPADSGFGHPFDLVAFEITASYQFDGQMSEAIGDIWGDYALSCPPSGEVSVMGSGNGAASIVDN